MDIKKIGLAGYSFDKGGIITGSAAGPDTVRGRNLLDRLSRLNLDVTDFGNANSTAAEIVAKNSFTTEESGIKDVAEVLQATQNIKSLVSNILTEEKFPLIIGGDHSVSIGSVAAVSEKREQEGKKTGLIWIDTHSDINFPATSPSKRAFGMSVAFLAGLIEGTFKPVAPIPLENIAFIGLRDVDPGERKIIKENKISAHTIKDIDLNGIQKTVEQAIETASKGTDGFVVSFDLDVCDPRIVPGTQTPIRGGLNFREAHLIVELLYESNLMKSFELVELNPELDRENITADLAVSLIESALGSTLI